MNYEPIIKQFFESKGYYVEKIAEDKSETPDFLITDNQFSYVLELKTKFPSTEEMEDRKCILESGNIYNIHELITTKNRLSGIIKKAGEQLKRYDEDNLFHIVWLLATGFLAEPRILQFEATLYGSSPIISSNGPSDAYFFYNSDFFRYRDILDGAIVSTESQLRLLLNPLSPRYAQLKASSLPKHLETAVVDPIQLEIDGKALIIESDVDRTDRNAVLCYLRQKYGIPDIMNLNMTYLSGTISLPTNPNQD